MSNTLPNTLPYPSAEQGSVGLQTSLELRPTVCIAGAVNISGAAKPVHYELEVPEEPAYDGIIALVPGFSSFERLSVAERQACAQLGFAAVSYDQSRGCRQDIGRSLSDSQRVHIEEIDAITRGLTLNPDLHLVPNLRTLDFSRFVLSAHSMGGLSATGFAEADHGSRTEAVIYKAAVGFGPPSIPSLLKFNYARLTRKFHADEQLSKGFHTEDWYRSLYYHWYNPAQTAGEMLSCLLDTKTDMLSQMSQDGIGTAYLGFELDGLVPPSDITTSAREQFDIFQVLPGLGHIAPQTRPNQVAAAATGLYHQLQAAQKTVSATANQRITVSV